MLIIIEFQRLTVTIPRRFMISLAHSARPIMIRLLCCLGLAPCLWLMGALPLLAQPSSEPTTTGDGSTSRTVGGGSRGGGSCAEAQEPGLTALVPKQAVERGDGQPKWVDLVTFTQQEQVALYVYIPPASAQLATLVVRDRATEQPLFWQEFNLTQADSIAQLLPPVITSENYTWTLTIDCGDETEIAVQGEIQRLAPDAILPDTLLWHESMAAWLAERETNPAAWQAGLAAQTGLVDYADRPVQTYVLDPDILDPDVWDVETVAPTNREP
ncbi:MAG: DUF928 domain-containing protein [Cyanobacteria bacterium P01_G01_bin.54]